jgi:hypothetical protein
MFAIICGVISCLGLILKDSISDHTHYFLIHGIPLEVGQYCLSEAQRAVEREIAQDQPDTVQGYGAN